MPGLNVKQLFCFFWHVFPVEDIGSISVAIHMECQGVNAYCCLRFIPHPRWSITFVKLKLFSHFFLLRSRSLWLRRIFFSNGAMTIRQMCEELRDCKILSRDEEYELGTKIQALMHYLQVRQQLGEYLGRQPLPQEWADACSMSSLDLQVMIKKEEKNQEYIPGVCYGAGPSVFSAAPMVFCLSRGVLFPRSVPKSGRSAHCFFFSNYSLVKTMRDTVSVIKY